MLLPAGYYDLAPGTLGTVVTSLEMFAPPAPRPEPSASDWEFRHVETPSIEWYRGVFRRIGSAYLWASRLTMPDEGLRAVLGDPGNDVFVLRAGGADVGLAELDFTLPQQCELSFFGVTPELVGCGAGRWLMNRTLEYVWSKPLRRFWVHTCTLDHSGALAFYERSGFRPFKIQLEVFPDPRLSGHLAVDAAPHVPLL